MHWSFRKYWVAELCRSSKYWHIALHNIQKAKSHLLVTLPASPQDICKYWEAVELIVADRFSKILIFAWKLKLYHWQQIRSVVFLEVTDSLCSFWKNCLPNAEVWVTTVFQFFNVSLKGSSPTCCSPQEYHHILACNTSGFCVLVSSHRILKRHVVKGWGLITWINFTAPSKTFVSETGVFLPQTGRLVSSARALMGWDAGVFHCVDSDGPQAVVFYH